MEGFKDALKVLQDAISNQPAIVHVPDGQLYNPGFLTALACYGRRCNWRAENFDFGENVRSYASAMRFGAAVWDQDDYAHERKSAGLSYSPLIHLASEDSVDWATNQIGDCLVTFGKGIIPESAINRIRRAIGEVHDNVWSHGRSSGFSMAQRYNKSWAQGRGHYMLHFALADLGNGFRREMQRVGLPVGDDLDAIRWCLREGNTTKPTRNDDGWVQSLPPDLAGNPMPGVRTRTRSENHHQGLGLHILRTTVRELRGRLQIASGCGFYEYDGERDREQVGGLETGWDGVAIHCWFDSETIARLGLTKESSTCDTIQTAALRWREP